MRHITVVIIAAVLLISCGKTDPINTIVDGPTRLAMKFEPPEEIFWENGDYLDADAATIMNGYDTESSNYDTVWDDDEYHNWSVAVALEYDDTNETAVVYRFLGDDWEMDIMPPSAYIPDLTGIIRFPRVASNYFYVSENLDFVEVAVAYQYWDEDDDDWDIGVVRMEFNDEDFSEYILENITEIEPNGDPVFVELDTDLGISEIHPDIAYDPASGDLWLVFSQSGAPGVWHTFVNCGRRYGPNMDLMLWLTTSAQVAQNTTTDTHNGFHPRIDIGKVQLKDFATPEWLTLIAYTGGREPGTAINDRWHIRVNYWPVDDVPEYNEMYQNYRIPEHEFPDNPGGVPMIDIAPQGSDFAALVWTQAKSDDWSNCTIAYFDSKYGMYHQTPDPDWGSECSAFPSVVAHENPPGQKYYASVSYLLTENYVNEYWHPRAIRYETDTQVDWPDKTGPVTSSELSISTQVHGKWDPGGLVEHYLGLSTSLTVTDDNEYWMIWSGFEAGAGPDTVYGSYGKTTQ